MTAYLSPIGNSQFEDANGNPLTGGKVYTYLAGTSTPETTWTTSEGDVAQANPIVLNSLGATANPIWLTAGVAYKFVIKDSADVTTLYTFDNITGINDPTVVANPTPEWTASTMALSYVAATIFSAVGDQTVTLPIGIRVKTTNTAGLVYSRVASAVFSAGSTTVTLVNDAGTALDSGLSALSYSILSPTKPSLPNSQAVRDVMGIPYAIGRNLLLNSSMLVNQDARVLSASNITLASGEYLLDGLRAGTGGAVVHFETVYVSGSPRIMTIVSGSMQCPFEWYRIQELSYPYVLSWTGTSLGNIYDTNVGGGNTPGGTSPIRGTFNAAPSGNSIWVEFGVGTVTLPQLELGGTVTPYEYKTAASELIECQRYYEPAVTINMRGTSGTANFLSTYAPFKVTKRATPTMTLNAAGTTGNCTLPAGEVLIANTDGFQYNLTANVANTDTYILGRTFKANARL
jgi:hypothetical protein